PTVLASTWPAGGRSRALRRARCAPTAFALSRTVYYWGVHGLNRSQHNLPVLRLPTRANETCVCADTCRPGGPASVSVQRERAGTGSFAYVLTAPCSASNCRDEGRRDARSAPC